MNFKINESEQKLRGGYYTPEDIAVFLTKWIKSAEDSIKVLEPSIGDGVFLDAIKKLELKNIYLTGLDIEEDELNKSRDKAETFSICSDLMKRDFLSWALLRFKEETRFDAVLGNPPFIRYQYMDKITQGYSELIFKHFHLPFTKHTNLWVPFIIASLALLKKNGRLAMVVPSEILHVTHAQSLRNYISQACSKVVIIDPEEIWFEDTLQGAVILLVQKKEIETDKFKGISIIPMKGSEFLNDDPNELFNNAESINGDTIKGKWLRALLTKKEITFYEEVLQRLNVKNFSELAKVDVGIVTGANHFFLVNDETVKKYRLQKWSYPMFGRSEHCPGVIYNEEQHNRNKEAGLPANFLWFKLENVEDYSECVKKYFDIAIEEKIPERYKCRIRKPWFKVPSVYSTNIGLLKRCHEIPKLIYNKLEAYTTDTAYRIISFDTNPELLVYSFINTITMISAELEGRHYGGGVLELIPSEIERLKIPVTDIKPDLKSLNKMFLDKVSVDKILEHQDNIILKKLGLNFNEIKKLSKIRTKLKNRRLRI